jgi:hypothetical protein
VGRVACARLPVHRFELVLEGVVEQLMAVEAKEAKKCPDTD